MVTWSRTVTFTGACENSPGRFWQQTVVKGESIFFSGKDFDKNLSLSKSSSMIFSSQNFNPWFQTMFTFFSANFDTGSWCCIVHGFFAKFIGTQRLEIRLTSQWLQYFAEAVSSIGFEDLIRILTSMAVRTVCPNCQHFMIKSLMQSNNSNTKSSWSQLRQVR